MTARLLASLLVAGALAAADNRTTTGYSELVAAYGAALPDGANLVILQVEATDGSGNWAASATGELAGRTITYPFAATPPTAFSAHANLVARNLCGSSSGLLPGLGTLQVASVGIYRNRVLPLMSPPAVATCDVENHSLVSNTTTYNLAYSRALDFRIARDGVTVVVAQGNGSGAMQPLWANSYHAISVGVTSGDHTSGGTNLETAGRMKPDLVANAGYTSYSTPIVASAAGLLIAECKRTAALAAARDPRAVKALLLAGATKGECPGWTRTASRPLDPTWGAGEVNIANSYRMLLAGRQATGAAFRPLRGWDTAASAATSRYFLQVPTGSTLALSAVLAWHRPLATSDYWSYTGTEAPNLDLRLRSASGSFVPGATIDESLSTIDNVEHIYQTGLPAGAYTLEVTGPAGIAYGIAWNGVLSGAAANTAPTIASLADQTTAEDTATAVSVAIGDAETAASALTLTATSSNAALLPTAGIALGGSGAARTLTLTPAANATGSATITVTVSDGELTASRSFLLTVTAVNDAPTITAIAAQSMAAGTTRTVSFTVGDAETAAAALTVGATASDAALLPAAGLVPGGSGSARTLALAPAAGRTGSATVTVTVSDGSLVASRTFTVTVSGDVTPPATPAAPVVAGDGGPAPVVSGTTEAAAAVAIRVDGTVVATVTAGADGRWSWTAIGLADGTHSLTVIARDAAGNASGASPAATVTVAAAPGGVGVAAAGGGGGGGCGSGLAALLLAVAFLRFHAPRRRQDRRGGAP